MRSIADLPDFILISVLAQLDAKSKLRCESVCRKWQKLARENAWSAVREFSTLEKCIFCGRVSCLAQAGHFQAVFECLSARCPLRSIQVTHTNLSASHLNRLRGTLHALTLTGVKFQATSPDSSVSKVLMKMHSLEVLDVSQVSKCELFGAGTCPITEWSACRFLKNLQILSLTDVHFCCDHLCETLPHLTSLVKLRLDVTCFCKRMTSSPLGRALAPLNELKVLIFENNFPNFRIPADLVSNIGASLQGLVTLWLTQCDFGDDSLVQLFENLWYLRNLGLVGAPRVTNEGLVRVGQTMDTVNRDRRRVLSAYLCGTGVTAPIDATNINVQTGFPSSVCDAFWDMDV